MARAIVLLSGGLDSLLAVKVLQEQGIDLVAMHFSLPTVHANAKEEFQKSLSQLEKIKFIDIDCTKGKYFKKFINMIRKPRHGYGANINPCVDCKIFMLKIARKMMRKLKADFIATGEVLNERPMSQYKGALVKIEKESGLQGKLLRPLSAKLLGETDAEKKGLVDRKRLLDIDGRQRKVQLELAKKYNLSFFPTPAGGCLLCEREFASKLLDLFKYGKRIKPTDIALLKIGRHFRFNRCKIIVGRNDKENKELKRFRGLKLEPANNLPGPTALLTKWNKAVIRKAAELVAYYSDKQQPMDIVYGKESFNKSIFVHLPEEKEVEILRI